MNTLWALFSIVGGMLETRQKLGNRLFSLGSFVRDIGKQWTLEQQQGIFLKATMDINDQLFISAIWGHVDIRQ